MPLRVILHAFLESKLVWFSSEFGYNVLLLGLDGSEARSFNRKKHDRATRMTKAYGTSSFEEYDLDADTMTRLGVQLLPSTNTYLLEHPDLTQCQVFVHDDFLFHVASPDASVLAEVVHSILRMHSFYMGLDIDWLPVLDEVVGRIGRSPKHVLLESDVAHRCLRIRDEGFSSHIKAVLSPKSSCFANIKGNTAVLEG